MIRGFDIKYSFNDIQVRNDIYSFFQEYDVQNIDISSSTVIITLLDLVEIFINLREIEGKKNQFLISLYIFDPVTDKVVLDEINFYQLDTFAVIHYAYRVLLEYRHKQ